MSFKHTTTVWTIRQGVRFAWAMARAARQLGEAGERLEVRLDAMATARGVNILDALEPLLIVA
jgi:hypothetical protein